MELGQLAIGAAIGILIGCLFVWLLDLRHQKTIKKLVESRKKIERQRTQAVHELFALHSADTAAGPNAGAPATGGAVARPPSAIPSDSELMRENAELTAEVTSLRTLIARADGALTSARRKRDEHEHEIARLQHENARLQSMISSGPQPTGADNVVDLHAAERMAAGSAVPRSSHPSGGLAL